jgi:hypothetical protein
MHSTMSPLGMFVALWIIWLLIGYPHITGELIFQRVMPVDLSHNMNDVLNRGTKLMMYLANLTLFPSLRK